MRNPYRSRSRSRDTGRSKPSTGLQDLSDSDIPEDTGDEAPLVAGDLPSSTTAAASPSVSAPQSAATAVETTHVTMLDDDDDDDNSDEIGDIPSNSHERGDEQLNDLQQHADSLLLTDYAAAAGQPSGLNTPTECDCSDGGTLCDEDSVPESIEPEPEFEPYVTHFGPLDHHVRCHHCLMREDEVGIHHVCPCGYMLCEDCCDDGYMCCQDPLREAKEVISL